MKYKETYKIETNKDIKILSALTIIGSITILVMIANLI